MSEQDIWDLRESDRRFNALSLEEKAKYFNITAQTNGQNIRYKVEDGRITVANYNPKCQCGECELEHARRK